MTSSSAMQSKLSARATTYYPWPPGFVPPATADPNYVPPKRNLALVVLSALFMAMAFLAVCVRIIVRVNCRGQRFARDDLAMIIATLFCLGFTGVNVAAYYVTGGGKHAYDSSLQELINAIKYSFAHTLLYVTTMMLIRVSVILSYKRMMPKRSKLMTVTLCALMTYVLSLWTVDVFTTIFSCRPIRIAWDLLARARKYHCGNAALEVLLLNCFGSAADAFLIMVPMRMVWKMKLARRSRIGALLLIALGGFVTACAIIRCFYVFHAYRSFDITWSGLNLLLWAELEATWGIIAGSLPALDCILLRVRRRRQGDKPFFEKWTGPQRISRTGDSLATTINPDVWYAPSHMIEKQDPSMTLHTDTYPGDEAMGDLLPWITEAKDVSEASSPSISSSVGAGDYRAYPPRPPPPLNAHAPTASDTSRGITITSNWITRNPTTTVITALHQRQEEEQAEFIRNSRASDARLRTGTESRHSSSTTQSRRDRNTPPPFFSHNATAPLPPLPVPPPRSKRGKKASASNSRDFLSAAIASPSSHAYRSRHAVAQRVPLSSQFSGHSSSSQSGDNRSGRLTSQHSVETLALPIQGPGLTLSPGSSISGRFSRWRRSGT